MGLYHLRKRCSAACLWIWVVAECIQIHGTTHETTSLETTTIEVDGESLSTTLPFSTTTLNMNSHTITANEMTVGQLRPSDLPSPETFNNFVRNSTVQISGRIGTQRILHGTVQQINPIQTQRSTGKNSTKLNSDILYLPTLVEGDEVESILSLVRNFDHFDEDPDTVDGMPTQEIYVDSPSIRNRMKEDSQPQETEEVDENDAAATAAESTTSSIPRKERDYDPTTVPDRVKLRKQLQSILQPILRDRITPLVRLQYPHVCRSTTNTTMSEDDSNTDRACTPCYSLIRRYRHGERQSVDTHQDGHALITVVVSLSNYGTSYLGGLYVSTGHGQREFVPLYTGDAVAHQSSLLHGVQVLDVVGAASSRNATERWSWVLWYRDSSECIDYSYEWFAACADEGDPVCQELHALTIENIPPENGDEETDEEFRLRQRRNRQLRTQLFMAAAEQGNGNAAIIMARVHLQLLPGAQEYNQSEAVRYYKIAMSAGHPDGFYGMANLYLEELQEEEAPIPNQSTDDIILLRVVGLLEEAAKRGHAFAMFNLGMVHCFGYGTNHIDADLAALWFIQSGLPEGYYLAAQQALSIGDVSRHEQLDQHARKLGYYEPWRKRARKRAGSGGSSGVDLNMEWPASAIDGRQPSDI
jgi:hypothetical protein